MHPNSRKTFAKLIVAVSVIGLLLSIFMLVEIWRLRTPVTAHLLEGTNQVSTLLQTTADGLTTMDRMVSNVYTSTENLKSVSQSFVQTMQSTDTFIGSAGSFVGGDLVNTITNTQVALESAQASAVVIDNLLSTLSKVPLIGIQYNPALPLNVALGEVASSLDPLKGSLKDFQFNLGSTQTNMQIFSSQVTLMEQNITAINQNLLTVRTIILDYHTQLSGLQESVDRTRDALGRWVNLSCWILTLVIFWFSCVQLANLLHGWMTVKELDELKSGPLQEKNGESGSAEESTSHD